MTLFYSKFRYLEPILAEIIYAGAGPESFFQKGVQILRYHLLISYLLISSYFTEGKQIL